MNEYNCGEYRRLNCSGGVYFVYLLNGHKYKRNVLYCVITEQLKGGVYTLPESDWLRLERCDKHGNILLY